MKQLLKSLIFLLPVTVLTVACNNDDDYNYPNVYTEFVDLKTNGSGSVDKLITDEGKIWNVNILQGLTNLVNDTTYRTVSKFVPDLSSSDSKATLYTSQGVIAPIPQLKNQFKTIITDAVELTSIWRSGNYINIILNVLVKDKTHKYHFVQDRIEKDKNGVQTLYITLYHDNNDDYPAFYRTTYLSVPLWHYNNILNKGDNIVIDINTYKDGFISKEFTF